MGTYYVFPLALVLCPLCILFSRLNQISEMFWILRFYSITNCKISGWVRTMTDLQLLSWMLDGGMQSSISCSALMYAQTMHGLVQWESFLKQFFVYLQDRSLDFHALCALYAVTGTSLYLKHLILVDQRSWECHV